MKKTLSKAQKSKLRTASREFPERYFVELPAHTKGKRWLAASNRYRERCVTKFEKDLKPPATIDNNQIAKYVSASGPAHVIDGWSFLGRAVDATLRGDRVSAVFFGYYAELRAAMSLLAAEGLGVLNGNHPVISKSGGSDVLRGKRTHDLAWLALNHWAGLKRSSVLINGLISPRGIQLSTWLDNLAPGRSLSALTDQWLSLWGIDLVAIGDDHDLRNQSSYRPSQFRVEQDLSVKAGLELVADLWTLLEPSRGERFPSLGRALLRRALRTLGVNSVSIADLSFIVMEDDEAAEWASFLSSDEESLVLTSASKQSGLDSVSCHLEVLSRASLLLSVATEASRRLLAAGSLDKELLRFWWERQGVERGLWTPRAVPDDPLDSWVDVGDALLATEEWTSTALPDTSFRDARLSLADNLSTLGAFEAVGMWGLVP